MKKRIVLALLCASIMLLAGCGLFVQKGTVTGVVTDSLTGEAISGVTIAVGTGNITTSDTGSYSLIIKADTYTLTATKDGYTAYEQEVVVAADGEIAVNFEMVSTEYANLSGVVTDVLTDEVVADAIVTIGDLTATTDVNGFYNFVTVDNGTYTITVTAADYYDYEGQVTVSAGAENTHNIQMDLLPGMITGYATEYRGGSALANALVSWGALTTFTDATGYFELEVPAGTVNDLFVEKEGYAGFRVQDVAGEAGEVVELAISSRPPFSPNWTTTPPVLVVSGVEPGAEISGIISLTVEVTGDLPCYVGYIYLGGEQRYPRDGFIVDANEGTFEIDTTLTPNGDSYIKVLAYDNNENAAMYIMPVTINNTANDEVLPGDIPAVNLVSSTFGINIGYYKHNKQTLFETRMGEPIDISAAPDGACIYNRLTWEPATDTDGYSVYRSFDGGVNYKLVGNVKMERYDDFSPLLAVGKETYYKVVPYNSFGEGNAFERFVTPLPAINVYLEGPANEATDVSLTPTFTWRVEGTDAMPAGTAFYSEVTLFDATDYMIWMGTDEENACSITLAGALAPGGVYSWDVSYSDAFALYAYDDFGYSYALSVAGDGEGSINGEFVFTTTTVVE